MEPFCYVKSSSQERKPEIKRKTFWEYFFIIYMDTKHSDYMQVYIHNMLTAGITIHSNPIS